MVKYSKSLIMLMGSVSLLGVMAPKLLRADEPIDDQGFFSRIMAAPKNLWQAMPDVKGSVQARGTAFAKQKAQNFLNQQADQVATVATQKLHALMYRHADVHVVNDDGQHVGFIEDVTPRVGRNLIKKALGIDLDQGIAGVPTFMSKAVIDVIEKQAANYLEANFQKNLNAALTQLSMEALQKGLGLVEEQVNSSLKSATTTPAAIKKEEKEIKKALVNATPGNVSLDQEELSAMSELVRAIKANLKFKIHSWLNDVANETASDFTARFVKQTGEGMLRGAEVAAGTAATLAAGALTGGTGAVVVGGLNYGDRYVAEGTPGDESYMRQALKWLTGYNAYETEIQNKITIAATNQVNINIDAVLKNVGLGSLVLTRQDSELLYGKYAAVEDEFGFTNLEKVEDAYSFTTFGNKIAGHLKEKAAQFSAAAKENAGVFGETAEDFALAFGPGLAYEPTEEEKLQGRAAQALEEGDHEKITQAYLDAKAMREAAEQAAKKSWWKIW